MSLDTEELLWELSQMGIIHIAGDMWFAAWIEDWTFDENGQQEKINWKAYVEGDSLHEILSKLYSQALIEYKKFTGQDWDSPFDWSLKKDSEPGTLLERAYGALGWCGGSADFAYPDGIAREGWVNYIQPLMDELSTEIARQRNGDVARWEDEGGAT